ncbi:hypothetical protein K503DRAFT_183776 [Rhizopogon vinicolor AM-OR11-026]|uniref:Uncharacterized protein n=1 Tax=Rhizopogon vinicolor AM-OR11-026 TaxID=1314800 RepID=A0A1B7N007_9AGAM|nr:hypothetical protein K503DRAFT_183776 [Rhizopogon vinicolor AM-OR11-026]
MGRQSWIAAKVPRAAGPKFTQEVHLSSRVIKFVYPKLKWHRNTTPSTHKVKFLNKYRIPMTAGGNDKDGDPYYVNSLWMTLAKSLAFLGNELDIHPGAHIFVRLKFVSSPGEEFTKWNMLLQGFVEVNFLGMQSELGFYMDREYLRTAYLLNSAIIPPRLRNPVDYFRQRFQRTQSNASVPDAETVLDRIELIEDERTVEADLEKKVTAWWLFGKIGEEKLEI